MRDIVKEADEAAEYIERGIVITVEKVEAGVYTAENSKMGDADELMAAAADMVACAIKGGLTVKQITNAVQMGIQEGMAAKGKLN